MSFLLQMQGKMLLLLLILSGYEEQLGFKDLECPLKKKFKKNSYVSSVIMVLTGIKPICSVCLVSHQPLFVSLQEEVKSTKMSIWSLPHTTKISENIYCENAKRLWSGDN